MARIAMGELQHYGLHSRLRVGADSPLVPFNAMIAKKYNVDDFQFSQAYPMFYDHLNKANVFLENIIELSEERLDSRIVTELISDPVEGELVVAQALLAHDYLD